MRLPEEQLKDAMRKLRITNADLAEHCGVRVETVYHWVKGKQRIPSRTARLIEALLKHKELNDAKLATSDGKQ